tara:strand:+ start:506 stop:961 length:456 start_codon:yes stop_codon:yes gene_type:complete
MLRNIIILFFFSFLLSNCDYTPIYSDKKSNNFSIEEINYTGDIEINTLINKKLKIYQKQEKSKKFNIDIKSSYQKISQSKDLTGKTTDYKIIIKVLFKIENNQKITTVQAQEDFVIKNITNEFEEKNYEKIKKENLTDLIVNSLIIQLSQI